MSSKVTYINDIMDRLYDLCDDLYEAMADEEDKDVVKICEGIIEIIRSVKSDHSGEYKI